MLIAGCLGVLSLVLELFLVIGKRRNWADFVVKDRHSYRAIAIVLPVSIAAAFSTEHLFRWARMREAFLLPAGLALYAAGMLLRWYAVFHLGRLFTPKVAIAADHHLIVTGPYRRLRHPSYTGALLVFVGIGLCVANWVSLLMIVLPLLAVYSLRIQEEENALLAAFGDEYRAYQKRTPRLLPFMF